MYEEDEWYIKFLKWLGKQIQKLLERYGWKKCIIATLLLVYWIINNCYIKLKMLQLR